MDSNTKKAKPYEYDELMFDGDMDRDRCLLYTSDAADE